MGHTFGEVKQHVNDVSMRQCCEQVRELKPGNDRLPSEVSWGEGQVTIKPNGEEAFSEVSEAGDTVGANLPVPPDEPPTEPDVLLDAMNFNQLNEALLTAKSEIIMTMSEGDIEDKLLEQMDSTVKQVQNNKDKVMISDGINRSIKINTGAELPAFIAKTMAKPYNNINVDVAELYAGGCTTAVALVLEGYGLNSLLSVEFNATQRKIGKHNIQILHNLFPERVSQRIVDSMHSGVQDVRSLTANDLLGRDIITAGFPCQDMTRANRHRKGFKGKRSGQYYSLEKLLKRVVRLEPSVTILLENVHFKETFPSDFARVCMAWGRGVVRDAADVSFEHRLRIWWGYNIKILYGVKVKGMDLSQVLEPEHVPRKAQYSDKTPFSKYNIQGLPQLKFVTQLTINDTYNVRSGDALVFNHEKGEMERPWVCELSRCAGWWDCFIAEAPVQASDKVFCLGNSQNLSEVRNILSK